MTDDRLDLGVEQTHRLLDTQLASVDAIQTKIGVLLGFTATSLVVLFAFGGTWVATHLAISTVSAVTLLSAAAIFGIAMMLEDYSDSPGPGWLVGLLNDETNSTETVKEKVIGDAWNAYDDNRKLIQQRFRLVNAAVILMIAGTAVFVVGVLTG